MKRLRFVLCFISVICVFILSFMEVFGALNLEDVDLVNDVKLSDIDFILTEIIYSPKSIEIPILLYHHFSEDEGNDSTIRIDIFERHIKALKENGYNTVTVTEMLNYVMGVGGLPMNPVCITFDDGYLSNLNIAYPILKKYDSKVTIFIIGHSVGRDTYKDTSYLITPHFTWNDANEMRNSGLVDIQSHSWDMHQWRDFEGENEYIRENMLKLSNETMHEYLVYLINDCYRMNEEFLKHLGYSPIALAYPRGDYNSLLENEVLKWGIKVTLNTDIGINKLVKNNLTSLIGLKRINIDDNISVDKLLEIVG